MPACNARVPWLPTPTPHMGQKGGHGSSQGERAWRRLLALTCTVQGGAAFGGTLAAPVFKEFARVATRGQPPLPFIAPEGVHMVRIERSSGRRVFGGWPAGDNEGAIIWEAFKAESEPRRSVRSDEIPLPTATARPRERARAEDAAPNQGQAQGEFVDRQGGGGIY